MSRSIELKSFEGDILSIREDAGMKMSELIRDFFGDGSWFPNPVHFKRIPSNILSKVIDYCEKHTDDTVTAEELKEFDSKFLQVDRKTLFGIITAATYMQIKNLLDLTCQDVVDKIDGATPEEILETLDIDSDFTYKEVSELYISSPWVFE